MIPDDFERRVLIHICKDGTISYRRRHEPIFNGVAAPVFSVDTEHEALALSARFGRLQWVEHPDIPGRPWYRWTNFSGDIDALDEVTAKCREWYKREKESTK